MSMAAFPSYARTLVDGYAESHSSIVERSEMDRGVPKQRKIQSDVLVTIPVKVLFATNDDAEAFEDWFYGDAQAGAAWFDWTDPRTKTLRQARIVAGSLGPLTPGGGFFSALSRTVTLEYLRSL